MIRPAIAEAADQLVGRTLEEVHAGGGRPAKGRGPRVDDRSCHLYLKCLDAAVALKWTSFHCGGCPRPVSAPPSEPPLHPVQFLLQPLTTAAPREEEKNVPAHDHKTPVRELLRIFGCSTNTLYATARGLRIKIATRTEEQHQELVEALQGRKQGKRRRSAAPPLEPHPTETPAVAPDSPRRDSAAAPGHDGLVVQVLQARYPGGVPAEKLPRALRLIRLLDDEAADL